MDGSWLPGGSMVTWWSEFVLSTICDHVLHDHDMIVSNMGFARERELKVEKLWNIVFVSCMNWWKAKLVWFEHILKIFPHCADSFELLHSEIFFKKNIDFCHLLFFLILFYWKGPKVIGLWKEGCFGSNFKWAVKFALMLSFILVTKSIYTRLRLKIYLYDLVLLCNSPEISNYSQTEMIKQFLKH